jgi:hypothetical protein
MISTQPSNKTAGMQDHMVDPRAGQTKSTETVQSWQKGAKDAEASHQDSAQVQAAKDANTAGLETP